MTVSETRRTQISREALAFAPGLLSIQESPPAPLPRAVLYTVGVLFALLTIWAVFGKLDIITSAEGRLVPRSYVKIVQPADAGIVTEILVHEGESVTAGQVLLRMDQQDAEADASTLATEVALKSLQLRRIEAELTGSALRREAADPVDLYQRVKAQYDDRRQAYRDSLAQANEHLAEAQEEYQAGVNTLDKLRKTNPLLKAQADSYGDLGRQGYAAQILVNEKQRQYIENDQDLRSQGAKVTSLEAAVSEAQQQTNEITSKYRSDLQNERVQAEGEFNKLRQDSIKQSHRAELLELRAPQAGVVKDLATHTIGTVVSAGTVLLSLVPEHEPMVAEVTVRNEDVGFVRQHQAVQVKLAPYPFQKYGTLRGEVAQLWPDAADGNNPASNATDSSKNAPARGSSSGYRALINLDDQSLKRGNLDLSLLAGMQVVAEINEGRRSVLEYLLSPVQRVVEESGRER